MKVSIEQRIDQYVKLRDHIKKLEDEHSAKIAPFKETLELLNSVLLKHLNDVGIDNAKTGAGTVYRTEKTSASIVDKEAFWNYVMVTNDLDLLDVKANKTAVAEFIEKNNGLPPGVNFNKVFVVGVRRG